MLVLVRDRREIKKMVLGGHSEGEKNINNLSTDSAHFNSVSV